MATKRTLVEAPRPFVAEICTEQLLRYYAGERLRFPEEAKAARAELTRRGLAAEAKRELARRGIA